jgi:hypothetical protein
MPDGASGFECAGGRFRIDSEWPAMRELIGFSSGWAFSRCTALHARAPPVRALRNPGQPRYPTLV